MSNDDYGPPPTWVNNSGYFIAGIAWGLAISAYIVEVMF